LRLATTFCTAITALSVGLLIVAHAQYASTD
jgi:hypothetical protein